MEIRDGRGILLGISEIVYPHYRVVVEVEGDHHRTSRAQWNRDLDKYDAYASGGWETVRLSSLHIRRNRDAVRRVAAALRRHGWDG
jgi:very-short-patch-repair endonuclease